MDATNGQMELSPSQKQAALKELLSLLLPADSTAEQAQMSEEEKLKAAYALNLCTVSVSQIIDYNDIFFLEQEYEAILNNLNLEEMPKDEALLRILKQLLDVITYFRIQEGEKKLLEKEYQQKMKNAIWNAVPNIGMIVAGGNPITMAISLASQVGIGYMNYRREKAKIGLEQERKEWELQRSAMEQFNGLRRELFDTAWRLADRYKFPDSYRLTERQITQYNRILMDPDDMRRYERLLYIQGNFMAYPPFWYYLGNAANAVYQNADKYGQAISEDYKAHAKDAFQKFLNGMKRNLLREDQLEASCCLEMFDLLEDKSERLKLLDRAQKASGNAFDVLQLCAMSYLKIGETQKAAELFRMLVNEEYNTKINGQLLSKIYVYQAVVESSRESRKAYHTLQIRAGAENLFPMPAADDNNVYLEWNFISGQKNCLREKYAIVITEFIQKYAEEYDLLLRMEGNISRDMLGLLEQMCSAVKMIAPDRFFGQHLQVAISNNRKEFQEMLICHNPANQRKRKIEFHTIAKDAFFSLAQYIGNRIDEMESMSAISEEELDVERFCAANHLSSQDTSQTKDLVINGAENGLAQILFDENFKTQHNLTQKGRKCIQLITEILDEKQLINGARKNLHFYVRDDYDFDTYLKKYETALLKAGFKRTESIIAIVNDKSISNADLILGTGSITLLAKKKSKGSIPYTQTAKYYTKDGLQFNGGCYANDGIDMSVLRKITDALAKLQAKYQNTNNENLAEMIQTIRSTIIGDSYHREFSTPPKPQTITRQGVPNSLLDKCRKGTK